MHWRRGLQKMGTRDRQLSIRGSDFCQHKSPEQIFTQGGSLLAELCRACGARLAEIGVCDGSCGKDEPMRLTAFLVSGARPRRFHSEDCKAQTLAEERALKAGRKPPPKGRRK